MKLSDALKGMHIKGWEMRMNQDGRKVVYVRYTADIEQ